MAEATLSAGPTLYGDKERLQAAATLGEGGGPQKGWAPKPTDVERCMLQPLVGGPKINYNEMLIKRQGVQ